VFLSLVLVVIISVLFSTISAARTNAIRFEIECVADMATQSSLAEYNRSLFERYGLLFVDTGYGTPHTGDTLLENHLIDYMNSNFTINQGIGTFSVKDHLGIKADGAIVGRASCATDLRGMVLEREALQYMSAKYGVSAVKNIIENTNTVQESDLLGSRVDDAWEEYEEKLRKEEEETVDDDGDKVEVEKPFETVQSYRESSGAVAQQTAAYVHGISENSVNLGEYISHRSYRSRDGFIQGEKQPDLMEDLIFQKYMMEHCGKYTNPRDTPRLAYEMEYIIAGTASDRANLEDVLIKLLVMRECSNYMHLQSDEFKQSQVRTLVLAISCLLLNPELEEPLTQLILLAWSYAESISDIKALLSGKRIPLVKSSDTWRTGLINALGMNVSSNKESGGLTYEEYLHILLAAVDSDARRMRFMDVIEMNIRETDNNESFKMDMCLHDYEVTMSAYSVYGGNYNITKLVGFQK